MSKKKYLTGYVHRLEDGLLVSYGPGDPAPDWVTNPNLLTDGAEPTPDPEPVPPSNPGNPQKSDVVTDDLSDLDGKSLKKIAGDLGLAKNGSLDAIRDRIRAKRAEHTPEPAGDADHQALLERAKELGIEVDPNMSDVELQVLIEGA